MSLFRPLLIASTLPLASGCASGLNSQQTAELEYYEARNLAVIEKSPAPARPSACSPAAAPSTAVPTDSEWSTCCSGRCRSSGTR